MPPNRPYTVLGHTGFIGSFLKAELSRRGLEYLAPGRDADLSGHDLGVVFYCIGVTADFRSRPLDTVEAHVGRLLDILRRCRFDRLVYLSSTRLYRDGGGGREDEALSVRPTSADDLYNLSKAAGESLALHGGRPAVVVRLSNVYGPDYASENFLPSLLRAALGDGVVRLRSSPESAKDYVSVRDVVEMLIRIAGGGSHRVYNLAGGCNVTHGSVLDVLRRLTGCRVEVDPGAARTVFPPIDVSRLSDEFGYVPSSLVDDLPSLIELYERDRDQWTRSPST
jgi:nucleoside-diphosphate-sugar epimerase